MRAVVMAGGQGMRMRPYTTVLPKPLLPVGDRPILQILLEQLAAAGTTRVDLCVGYLGSLIRAFLAETELAVGEMEIAFHTEQEPLGTAGALRDLPGLERADSFLSLNGDILTSLDFAAVMRHHRATDAALTVAVKPQRTEIGSGVLDLDGDRVTAWVEKPVLTHRVSLGIYAIAPRALALLPDGRADVPDLVDRLLAAGELVNAYQFDGAWYDIGTLSDHETAALDALERPERYLRDSGTPTPD